MIYASLCLCAMSFFVAPETPSNQDSIAKYKAEIEQAEKDFAAMAQTHSMREAFLAFAAPDAVLLRGKSLVRGREEFQKYFDQQTLKDVRLNWSPDFVDVSSSGDLGYTYGKYTLTAKDAAGNEIKDEGIFHTVWKRQADGSWKFVWD